MLADTTRSAILIADPFGLPGVLRQFTATANHPVRSRTPVCTASISATINLPSQILIYPCPGEYQDCVARRDFSQEDADFLRQYPACIPKKFSTTVLISKGDQYEHNR